MSNKTPSWMSAIPGDGTLRHEIGASLKPGGKFKPNLETAAKLFEGDPRESLPILIEAADDAVRDGVLVKVEEGLYVRTGAFDPRPLRIRVERLKREATDFRAQADALDLEIAEMGDALAALGFENKKGVRAT